MQTLSIRCVTDNINPNQHLNLILKKIRRLPKREMRRSKILLLRISLRKRIKMIRSTSQITINLTNEITRRITWRSIQRTVPETIPKTIQKSTRRTAQKTIARIKVLNQAKNKKTRRWNSQRKTTINHNKMGIFMIQTRMPRASTHSMSINLMIKMNNSCLI